MKIIRIFALIMISSCKNPSPVKIQEKREVPCEIDCNCLCPNYYDMDLEIAWEDMGKIYKIIEELRVINRKLPQTNSKKDFQFLFNYISEQVPDSVEYYNQYNFYAYKSGNIVEELIANSIYDSLMISPNGTPYSYILYDRINNEQYILYWVGCNGRDDNAKGDDIIYAK